MRNPFRRQPKPTPEWGDHISTAIIPVPEAAEVPSGEVRSDTAKGGAVDWESALKAEMRRMMDSHIIKNKEEYDNCPLCMVDQKRYRQNLRLSRIGRTLAMVNRENRNLRLALKRAMEVIGTNMVEDEELLGSNGWESGFKDDIRYIHGHIPDAKMVTNMAYDAQCARLAGDYKSKPDPNPTEYEFIELPSLPKIDPRDVLFKHRAECRICNPRLPDSVDYVSKRD